MEKVNKTEQEWQELLTSEQYRVTRLKGTEQRFSGPYHDHKESGRYHCVACQLELFASKAKFDSGTGWPSFFQPVNEGHVEEHTDDSHGMQRTEVLCARCEAHLGHVFEDGPKPTGQRYCINSVALNFVAAKNE